MPVMKRTVIRRSNKVFNAENSATDVVSQTGGPAMELTIAKVKELAKKKEDRKIYQIAQAQSILAHNPDEPLNALWSLLEDKSLIGFEPAMAIVKDARCGLNCELHSLTIDGATPLILALHASRLDFVEALIVAGADIDYRSGKDKMTPMHLAVKTGYLEGAKFLASKGAYLEIRDLEGNTPLHFAASNGNAKLVSFLLQKKVSTKVHSVQQNDTYTFEIRYAPIHKAALKGHLDVVKAFIEYSSKEINATCYRFGKDLRHTPLHAAASHGQLHVVKYLVEKGADIHAKDADSQTPLSVAATKKGNLELIKYLVSKGSEIETDLESLLVSAVRCDDAELVKFFIVKSTTMDFFTDGQTPLHIAVKTRSNENVKILLNHGASFLKDDSGDTAFQKLIDRNWSPSMAELFVAHGVEIDQSILIYAARHSEDGDALCMLLPHFAKPKQVINTLLFECARYGCIKTLEFIVGQNADVNAKDTRGATPLHYCTIGFGHVKKIVIALIKHNANVNARDIKGQTPLHYFIAKTCSRGSLWACLDLDIITILINNGADPHIKDINGITPLSMVLESLIKGEIKSGNFGDPFTLVKLLSSDFANKKNK